MKDDSFIKLTGLYFELRPKSRPKDGPSMIESIWSSMSSSMQLAKDCLEHEGIGDGSTAGAQNTPMEGLERFAQVIDNGKASASLIPLTSELMEFDSFLQF